jgi:hypothetical protein
VTKRRAERLCVIDASLVPKTLIDLIDHRLNVQRDIVVWFGKRHVNRRQRSETVGSPDAANLSLSPGDQQRLSAFGPGIEHRHALAAAEQVEFYEAHIA